MDGEGKYGRPSPLRNSKAANRPFQSPLRSVLNPGVGKSDDNNDKSLKNSNIHSSPYGKSLITPKKSATISHCHPKLMANRLCQESKKPDGYRDEKRSIDEKDLEKIRVRISSKRRKLDHLKQEMIYSRKHESKDLNNLTERWLRGCQEALMQLQKDISERNGISVEITQILAELGIPPELVQYSIEDCDFV